MSNQPVGISGQRNWIVRNLVQPGEWYVSADDNIRTFIGPDGGVVSPKEVWQRLGFSRVKAEQECIRLVGLATVDNPYFRKTHWRRVGFVLGKCIVEQAGSLERDVQFTTMDDYDWTAAHLEHYGRVLINNALYPKAKHCEAGGIGTWDERLPRKLKDVERLMAKYPGLFRLKQKAGKPAASEIQLRFTRPEQVDAWRIKLRAFRGDLAARSTGT